MALIWGVSGACSRDLVILSVKAVAPTSNATPLQAGPPFDACSWDPNA